MLDWGGVMCTVVLVPWMPEALVLPETEDTGIQVVMS